MDLEQARKNISSENTRTVITSIITLGRSGEISDLQEILKFVNNENKTIQATAVKSACSLVLENLFSRFEKFTPEVREKLGSLLNRLDPKVVNEISRGVYSEESERRLRAVRTLGLLKNNPQVRNILAKLVQDRDQKVRATAVNLLGKVIGPNDQEIILSLLSDKDKRVRANTVEALESLGNRRMVPILQRFRKDPNNRIRGNVLKALFNLGHTDILQSVLEMLKTNDNFMQASALWVITQTKISNGEIIDIAGKGLISSNEMIYSNSEKALKAINTARASGYLRYLQNI